jgi:diaminohydroxyphosphoribosylaminopyrimidine deaminase/5-amino-6-(5-phosphoribosylamino)uracil reductase
LLSAEGERLNRRFFTFMRKKRRYILLKWAQTAYGFVARDDFSSMWISDSYSRRLVHKWRSEEAAVLVGTRTALHDNPRLDVRSWRCARQPYRVVIDRHASLPRTNHLFDGTQPTIIYTEEAEMPATAAVSVASWAILEKGFSLPEIVADLYSRRISSVLVEGGSALLHSFISQGLWDEARVFVSPNTFGAGIPAPHVSGGILASCEQLIADKLFVYRKS